MSPLSAGADQSPAMSIAEEEETAVIAEEGGGEASKLKTLLSLMRKVANVKDIANMRLSLPASWLEPVPNLEYWNYADRADLFALLGEPQEGEDAFTRMVDVIRFTLGKDIKHIKGTVVKPYNSVLGEHFRCHWIAPPAHGLRAATITSSDKSSASSFKSAKASSINASTPISDSAPASNANRVAFLTEQVSHHPPISAFVLQSEGVEARGVDQISAKVSGTTLKVYPGNFNKGIFVKIKRSSEEYQITHPVGIINGLLRGNFYATISDVTEIICRGGDSNLRTLLYYPDESWISKPRFLVEGVIYRYTPGTESEKWTKIKEVPADLIVASIEGCWKKEVKLKLPGGKLSTLIDFTDLEKLPRVVRPIEEQNPNESRRLWKEVTNALLAKEYSKATSAKQVIEQQQRDDTKLRTEQKLPWEPQYFAAEMDDGRPTLTELGQKVLNEELAVKA